MIDKAMRLITINCNRWLHILNNSFPGLQGKLSCITCNPSKPIAAGMSQVAARELPSKSQYTSSYLCCYPNLITIPLKIS